MTNPARRAARAGKLELLPVMNLVTILIPLLLMAGQLAELATIDTTAPAARAAEASVPAATEEPLVVRISGAGVRLVGVPATVDVEQDLRCVGDVCARTADYPLAALTDQLETVKAARPDDDRVTIEATGDVPYGVLVAVMDAARGRPGDRPLFPRVAVSGGAPR